jgi:hypothetical protein
MSNGKWRVQRNEFEEAYHNPPKVIAGYTMVPSRKPGVAVHNTCAQRPGTPGISGDKPQHKQFSPKAVEKDIPGTGEHRYVTAGAAFLIGHISYNLLLPLCRVSVLYV